jgi:hypothetical protein
MVQGKYERINHVLKALPQSEWVVTLDAHQSLVDREVFGEIQKRLASNSNRPSRSQKGLSSNIFIGKIVCGHCGYALARRRSYKNTHNFDCRTSAVHGDGGCPTVSINESILKETLLCLLKKQAEVFAGQQAEMDKETLSVTKELRDTQSEIGRSQGFFKGLYESLVSGDITDSEYKDLKSSYEAKLESLTKRESELREISLKQTVIAIKGKKSMERIAALQGVDDLTREMLDALVEKIFVFGGKRIKIQFRFADEAAEVNADG